MAKQKKLIEFKHSGIENVVILGMILAFFVILAPLAYTQLPAADTAPKYDEITGLATGNIMEADVTTAIIIILCVAFLIPVELSLRKHDARKWNVKHSTKTMNKGYTLSAIRKKR